MGFIVYGNKDLLVVFMVIFLLVKVVWVLGIVNI